MSNPSDEQLSKLANDLDQAALVVEDSLSHNLYRDLDRLRLALLQVHRATSSALDALGIPVSNNPDQGGQS